MLQEMERAGRSQKRRAKNRREEQAGQRRQENGERADLPWARQCWTRTGAPASTPVGPTAGRRLPAAADPGKGRSLEKDRIVRRNKKMGRKQGKAG